MRYFRHELISDRDLSAEGDEDAEDAEDAKAIYDVDWSPLRCAVIKRKLDFIRALLKRGDDPKAVDLAKRMHYAVETRTQEDLELVI
jgi:hypothetical protein